MELIGVVGAGTMGAGIAQLAAMHGCRVRLVDVSPDVLDRAVDGIAKTLEKAVQKGKLTAGERETALARLTPCPSVRRLGDVELVIEAVIERLDVKQRLFQDLETAVPHNAVLATNTSSLSVSKIAEAAARPERVVGMHFFNPAPLMPLVEIIAGVRSAAAALNIATECARTWGKTAVRAKDTPGFIVNRVARGYYLEALRMLGEGVAGVAAIDATMRELGGFKMGPFELMDLVGLDVNFAVSTSVWEQFGKPPRLEPHAIQKRLVAEGRLGRKSGQGFYRYDVDPPVPAVEPEGRAETPWREVAVAVDAFAAAAAIKPGNETQRYVFARILATVMNEAALALDEQVATSADIDTAMQKGTNYPQGPLAWAKRVGHGKVLDVLDLLGRAAGNLRFAPAASWRR